MALRYDGAARYPSASSPEPAWEWRLFRDRDNNTLLSIWSLVGTSFVFALGRFYVRGFMAGRLQQDDYLIMVTLSCMVASRGLTTKAVSHGIGRHIETVPREDQTAVVKWIYLASCPGVLTLGIPKLAVITLLVRILNPGKAHRRFLWAVGTVVQLSFLTAIAMFLNVLLGKCPPLESDQIRHHCVSPKTQVNYCLYAGSLSASVDIYLAIYPSIVLYRLQMPLRQKAACSIALGLGVFSGAAGIYKTLHLPALSSPDFIYANAGLMLWTVVESTSLIIASSIPVLQPLLTAIFRFSVLGRCGKTVKGPYVIMVSHCGKIATAIQRRIGEANNIEILTGVGEDLEAHQRHNGSAVARECPASSTPAAEYQYSERAIHEKQPHQ